MTRSRLREAEGRVVPELFRFAVDRWGKEFFAEAWAEFFLWDAVPEDVESAPEFGTLFMPWFVFSFAADPSLPDALPDAPDQAIGLAYLDQSHRALPDLDRQLIEVACRSPFSFYAIGHVEPGRSIGLRDILSGHECRVLEQSASTMVDVGTILYGQVVTVGDASIMLGCSPLQIPPTWHNHIIDFRQEIWKRRPQAPEQLLDHDLEIRDLYLHIADALINPRPPQIRNTDGDPLLPTTLEFELRCSVRAAYDALKRLTLMEEDEVLGEADLTPAGDLIRVTVPWHKKTSRSRRDWEHTILGTLTIEPGRLEASVNSKRRADRLRREVAKRLGSKAVFAESRVEPLEQLLEQAARERASSAERSRDDVELVDPALQQVERELMARHWEAWLDERVPALGDRTPREAVKTALGRERLQALFTEFAWRAEHTPPHMRVDLAALRRKLGM